ncbi:tetratricopeptide repeat protein [Nostoc sp.]|uniref:tetratricopeptide repeat protein n=1 Tax=Nostoc sp. TaxID=1180 RepID=UPI002FFB3EB7
MTQRSLKISQEFIERGLALFKLGRFEEAIASYDKAIEIKPDFYEAWLYRGEALANLGRIEEAIHDYGQALVITQEIDARSKQASCLNNLGNAILRL